MSAGLPGLGLGGLFFIFSALLAPFIEIGRMAIGRRREVQWREVWRQFALALTMIAAVDLTLRVLYAFSHLLGLGDTPRLDVITVIPLIPVAITACILAAVLLTAKAVDLATPVLRDLPPISAALPSRTRVLAVTGLVGAIWFALLFSGANDLTRLPGRDGGTEKVPAGSALADADDAGDAVAMADASGESAEAEATEVVAGPSETGQASGDTVNAEASTSTVAAGSPAGADAAADVAAVPADAVQPTGPAPTASAPATAGPSETTAPETSEPAPSEVAGPPEGAGPPDHSSAPTHAGPS